MSEYDLREKMQSRIFSLCVCLSLLVTREMVESLHVATFCYGIRITKGNVWNDASASTFPRDYASWQVYNQRDRNTLMCVIPVVCV